MAPKASTVGRRLKYVRAREHLQHEIATGRILPGDAFPSETDLARSLGMARNTIRQALDELERQGVIHRIQGKGTFFNTDRQKRAHEQLAMFGLVVPQVREGFYPSLCQGVERTADGMRHSVVICNSENDLTKQGQVLSQLLDKNVGGVALVPTTSPATPPYQVRQLQENHIPVVFCHRPVEGVSAPCVTWCWEEIGRLTAEALIERGHRRVACLFSHRYPVSEAKVAGVREVFSRKGLKFPADGVIFYRDPAGTIADHEASAERVVRELLSSPSRPTAVACNFEPDAELVYLTAVHLGLRIPQDLSIIGFGGTWRPGPLARRIAAVVVDEFEVGAQAVRLLYEMRTSRRAVDNDERVMMPLDLVIGETLGPAPS